MALVVSNSGDDKASRSSFRAEKRPWMLQDYLRDDVNSCSSNGFRSFPRRECCAAVMSIIEKEFTRKGRNNSKPPTTKRLTRSRTISLALRRASIAFINAVKLLPFKSPAAGSSSESGEAKRLLPRSFSKKLFKRSFWCRSKRSSGGERKAVKKDDDECDEIERWISSGVVASEKYQLLDLSNKTAVTKASAATRNSNSDAWSDLSFSTSDYLTTSSENDGVERREKFPVVDVAEVLVEEEEQVSEGDGATTGQDSVESAVSKNTWQNEEVEKEQFSPISVMDFPDKDEGSTSPFTLRVTRLKGSRERFMKKLGRFGTLAGLGLEPINLEGLMCSTLVKDRSAELSIQSCATPTFILSSDSQEEEDEEDEEEEEAISPENEEEKKVELLLQTVKAKLPTTTSYTYELDMVLLDYFREHVTEKEEDELLKGAEGWLNGHYHRLILGWEVKDKRQAYIRDMEEGGRWPRDNKLEMEEVVNELEVLVMAHLIEELLLE